ncbi:MAG: ABC transporter ATP-binding protein [candidate division Zixibacteria bacterium]|nr:ABC transporter ATP-binding protein [candidate division Zixibacteria bacterium]
MNAIRAANLSKTYGHIKALRDFSFAVNPGEIFALVGPDGAGKTTLIRLLCHLATPDSGTVMIAGLDVQTSHEQIKPHLGYMPQHFSLYPDLSVEENLKFYAGIYGLRGPEYRDKRDYLYTFSNLAPFADRRAGALSGGMKQKLALSCALIHDPEVLILDEPTTGVDPLSRRQFWEILLGLRARGTAILVTTPYMDEVARADRACFVYDGQKLSEGTPDELTGQFSGRIFFLDREPTRRLVRDLDAIEGLSARRFGSGLHLYIDQDARIEEFRRPLEHLGIDASNLTPTPADLEDRFIQLMESGTS